MTTERRFVIETAKGAPKYGILMFQKDEYRDFGGSSRHGQLSTGMVNPIGGVAEFWERTLVGYVRGSGSIPGATENEMYRAKNEGIEEINELGNEDGSFKTLRAKQIVEPRTIQTPMGEVHAIGGDYLIVVAEGSSVKEYVIDAGIMLRTRVLVGEENVYGYGDWERK